MPSRRAFLAGILAAASVPRASWADAGDPGYLSAARATDGTYRLCGLTPDGHLVFSLPLPGRGHAAAAHPHHPQAVAFARRPGTFADVIDCATGVHTARLAAPPGLHFYGHGSFSADGARLYTTENDLETLEGRIGIWDAGSGYARIGDIPSGGIGPHDLRRLPGSDTLIVANGGIATHPDSGRAKLNLPTMRANLTYLDDRGAVLDQIALPDAQRLNSIRHLSIRPDGVVAAAMQWQGAETIHPPLLLLHRLGGGAPRLLEAPGEIQRGLRGYAGSVSFSGNGAEVAITSPRGGAIHRFDGESGVFLGAVAVADVCGLGPAPGGFVASTGGGDILTIAGGSVVRTRHDALQWDNHLVSLA